MDAMWEWIKFSLRVWCAFQTANLILAVLLLAVVLGVLAGASVLGITFGQ